MFRSVIRLVRECKRKHTIPSILVFLVQNITTFFFLLSDIYPTMYAYVFVFNTNTFYVYSRMLNEWHTSWKDQIDKKKRRNKMNKVIITYNEMNLTWRKEKMVIKFLSIHYAKIVVILTIILKWIFATFRTVRKKFCMGFFFSFSLFTSDPFFSFLGHNKHSILYSHKIERCSNGNSILKFRHLYIRYNVHMHE